MEKKLEPAILCIRGGWKPQNGEPVQPPIYQNTTSKYDNTEEVAQLSDLKRSDYFYTRLTNPTNDAVVQKVTILKGSVGAILTSSGQAANFYAVFDICEAGPHIMASIETYGGAFNLFGVTIKKSGIDCTSVDQDASEKEIQKAFRPDTHATFGETISNPGCHVLDIRKFARIAHRNGVPLIVDNTFATSISCRPFEWGADAVTHSTTKYMDGHTAVVRGIVVDSGNFDWMAHADKLAGPCLPDDSYHGPTYAKDFGKMGYLIKLVAQLTYNPGSVLSPQNASSLGLGLETLHLRMAHHCQNAQRIAEFLGADERVAWAHYYGPESDQHYALEQKYLSGGPCGVTAFGLRGDRETTVESMDPLHFINITTHVADSRTCMLYPTSHTHRQPSDEQLRTADVDPTPICLSVDTEDVDDLLDDIKQSLG